ASVLRMLEQYVGPEVFRAGVRAYLDRHAYGNTETGDLWRALGETAKLPIPDVMDGWIFRPGYPLVTARFDARRRLVLAQQRFSYLPPEADTDAAQTWQVPVQVRVVTGSGIRTERLLLTGEEAVLDVPADVAAVVVNEGGHGFYRVRYAPDVLQGVL